MLCPKASNRFHQYENYNMLYYNHHSNHQQYESYNKSPLGNNNVDVMIKHNLYFNQLLYASHNLAEEEFGINLANFIILIRILIQNNIIDEP